MRELCAPPPVTAPPPLRRVDMAAEGARARARAKAKKGGAAAAAGEEGGEGAFNYRGEV